MDSHDPEETGMTRVIKPAVNQPVFMKTGKAARYNFFGYTKICQSKIIFFENLE
jgi:hypothetical protein